MPDIDEGLTINGEPAVSYEEGDVNAPGGFEAAMAGKVSGEVAEPEAETAEEEPEEEPLPGEGGDTEELPEEPEEESVAYWRERVEDMQRLVDRQGNELGQLRQWAADQQQAPPPQQPSAPLDIGALVEENGGQKMIDWAIDNDPNQIEEIARTWAMSGDPEGAVFYADYRAEQARLEYAPREQELPPALEQMSTERELTEIWREQRANDPQFASYEPGIALALSSPETPDEIKAMLVSGNPEHMRAAVGFLKPYAQLEALRAGTPAQQGSPESPVGDQPAEQERREQIRRTAIVTGSQRLQSAGTQPEAGEITSEQRIARFKDLFEEEPSTSISAGLTINGQPVLPSRPRRSQ